MALDIQESGKEQWELGESPDNKLVYGTLTLQVLLSTEYDKQHKIQKRHCLMSGT